MTYEEAADSLGGVMTNASGVTVLTLSGLNYTAGHRVALFSVTLLCYLMIWLVNIILILTIILDRSLHEPMYVFLCNLCLNGLYGTAGFYPKFLSDLLSSTRTISYAGCLLQSFVIHSSSGGDVSILTLMAYDRYVAICRPLVYRSVMSRQRVWALLSLSWLLPLFCMLMNTVTTSRYTLCGSTIHKLYCSNWLVTRLACSTSVAHSVVAYFNITFYAAHAFVIVWSYIHLLKTCLTSKENRSKFMQTCVSHLASLSLFALAVMLDLMYMRFGSSDFSAEFQNFMAVEILVIPPVMNPLIYGFKLTKVRNRILSYVNPPRKHPTFLGKV